MEKNWYQSLVESSTSGKLLSAGTYNTLLTDEKVELLPLLDASFQVRKFHHGREVSIHIINNAQNGLCSEDCSYCAQSRASTAHISKYTIKSDNEIFDEAKRAYDAGAHRYCMVYAGRSMNIDKVIHLGNLIRHIKKKYSMEVCVSAGILDEEAIKTLKDAGLDRMNHNLNTSASRYSQICSTHTFADRLQTLQAARKNGLDVCSGIIAGMGETAEELLELAMTLKDINASSIPINFLLPIPGNVLTKPKHLTPQYCLRILCLFRFINPTAEIRVAAGREEHLRSMEVLSLYPANSIFMDGYLNKKGNSRLRTLRMIQDAGFTIRSDKSLDTLLSKEEKSSGSKTTAQEPYTLKNLEELRPAASRS